jgi:hypothetical protein
VVRVYYDDPRGYAALPTREVIRVGTDAATDTYPETPVKYLSTRVSYDPGLGVVTEYFDENDQKSTTRSPRRSTTPWAASSSCGAPAPKRPRPVLGDQTPAPTPPS